MKRYSIILIITLFSTTSWEKDILLEDFAYGYKIEFSKGNSVYEATLPGFVYQTVTKPDLGDIRVFNSMSEIVPHQVISKDREEIEKDIAPPVQLKYFSLPTNNIKDLDLSGIKIKTDKRGTIIEVSQGAREQTRTKGLITSYIIDASGIEEPIRTLKLELDHPERKHYFSRVNLFASEDLKIWRVVNLGAVLANLEHQGESLIKDEISLEEEKAKYYRLSWSGNDGELKLSSVLAKFGKKIELESPSLVWESVPGIVDGEDNSIFNYELKGFLPVGDIRVKFDQANSMANIVLEARNNSDEQWQYSGEGTVYSLEKEGTRLEEAEISVPVKRLKFWRLKFNAHQESFGTNAPKLEFGWEPEKIRFLARGTPPFYIGFGNAGVESIKSVNLEDEKFSESTAQAQITERKVLGGESRLTYKPAYPWKSWILWAVLILGVSALGKIALTLMRTMKKEDQK